MRKLASGHGPIPATEPVRFGKPKNYQTVQAEVDLILSTNDKGALNCALQFGKIVFADDLDLRSFAKELTHFDRPIHVHGDVDMEGCYGLQGTLDHFHADGGIDLESCPYLLELGADVKIGLAEDNAALVISHSGVKTVKMPEVTGDFIAECLDHHVEFPEKFMVQGNCHFSHSHITRLPEGLCVYGEKLHVLGCNKLKTWPQVGYVEGDMLIKGSGLKKSEKPEGFIVNGRII